MSTTPFYRDTRVLAILAQIAFVVALILVALFLYSNVRQGLAATGRTFSWNFLNQTAGFEIAEGAVFRSSDSYRRAFVVGAINTIRVAGVGIILASLLGLLIGIARLSNNFLLRTLAMVYVEIIRNTPALVQLFFWYFAVILTLPDVKNHLAVPGLAIISNRGLVFTWPFVSEAGNGLAGWLVLALVAALITGYLHQRRLRAQGKLTSSFALPVGVFLVTMLIGFASTAMSGRLPDSLTYELRRGDRGTLFVDADANGQYDNGIDRPMRYVPVRLLGEGGNVLGETYTDREGAFLFFGLGEQKGTSVTWQKPTPIVLSQPEMQGFNIRGGLLITPEYAGVLLGLVLYTAAFIAEIVRAGINAVPKGQWEASRALGLSTGDILRMIVLPQALRIAIPPLTSQFLNLTKNSSLALAVGYPDLFSVSQTILNQSGAELQVFIVLMATYLGFSLITSAFTNWYNRRVALVER